MGGRVINNLRRCDAYCNSLQELQELQIAIQMKLIINTANTKSVVSVNCKDNSEADYWQWRGGTSEFIRVPQLRLCRRWQLYKSGHKNWLWVAWWCSHWLLFGEVKTSQSQLKYVCWKSCNVKVVKLKLCNESSPCVHISHMWLIWTQGLDSLHKKDERHINSLETWS